MLYSPLPLLPSLLSGYLLTDIFLLAFSEPKQRRVANCFDFVLPFSSTEKEKRERLRHGNWQPFLASQALVHLPSIPSVRISARLLSSCYPENMHQLLEALHWKHEAF